MIEESNMILSATLEANKNIIDKDTPSEQTVYVDYEEVGKELTVRSRRNGDRFYPLGMKGTKKLQDFFIDNKVSKDERDRVPIVESHGRIIWVAGYRIDERVKVDKKTTKLVKLSIQNL